jgi:hypothetical protein
MEHRASAKNKAGSNAFITHSDTKSNIPGRLSLPITFCIALIPSTNELNNADCGYQGHGTDRKITHLLYMDDWKVPGRSEDDLENEMYIVKAISKHININFALEKCARICFFF